MSSAAVEEQAPPLNDATTTKIDDEMLQDIVIFKEVCEVPAPFANDNERDVCRNIVEQLSEPEVDIIAKSSYAFWYLSSLPEHCPSDIVRTEMALKEVRRHYVGEGRKYNKTLLAIREAIELRKKYNIDGLRKCMDKKLDETCKDFKELITIQHGIVKQFESEQTMISRGKDKEGRVVHLKRLKGEAVKGVTDEEFTQMELYMGERSIAASEFLSRGRHEKMTAIFDFKDAKGPPSPSALKATVKAIQRMHPERVAHLLFLEPPLIMRAIFGIIRPFMAPETREKLRVAPNKNEKEKLCHELIDPECCEPDLVPTGKLTTPPNMEHFFFNVPFHRMYDDIPC